MRLLLLLVLGVSGSMWLPPLKMIPSKTFSHPSSGTLEKKNNGVCLFLSTVVNPKYWTLDYSKKFIQWMRNVFLISVKRQFKTPVPRVSVFKLLIRGNRWNPKLNDINHYGNKPGEIPVVWHSLTKLEEWHNIVRKTVLNNDCEWIASMWLDGDDAILDGYFKRITEELPRILTETTTSEGKPWLGGVFALRSPRWLEVGVNRCREIF